MSGTDSKAGGPDYLLLFTQAKSIAEKILEIRASEKPQCKSPPTRPCQVREQDEGSLSLFAYLTGTSGGGGRLRFFSHSVLMLCLAVLRGNLSRSGMKISSPACGVMRV